MRFTQNILQSHNRILSLFSHGMSYTAIKDHIAEIYQLEVSEATISSVADQLIPKLKAWQSPFYQWICVAY